MKKVSASLYFLVRVKNFEIKFLTFTSAGVDIINEKLEPSKIIFATSPL